MQPALRSDQIKGEALLVNWIATSLRPFSIVEDSGFRDLVDFLSNLNKHFLIPGRRKVRDQIESYGELVRIKMRNKINNDVNYYSTTTDIWSSRTMESFMAITLHALSRDFEMINMTIEIDPLIGRHTGEMICTRMSDAFERWNLNKEKLVLLLRDNASNATKACNDFEIESFGCIGHSLHLIVGPLFVPKNNGINNEEVIDDVVDYDNDEVIELLDAFTNESYKRNVTYLNKVVSNFRQIAKYIRKSTIAKEKLEKLQKANGVNQTLSLELDVRTRWNSTFFMLEKFIKLKTSIRIFLEVLLSSDGQREFRNKSLPLIQEEDWALVEGTCILIRIFAKATEVLSGENFPTFIYAMPILRKIKCYLSNGEMFSRTSEDSEVKQLYEKYGRTRFISSVVQKLNVIRTGLLNEYLSRFRGLTIEIMWTSMLDPRLRTLKHLSMMEREEAKTILVGEVEKVLLSNEEVNTSDIPKESSATMGDDAFDIFDSPLRGFEETQEEETNNEDVQAQKLILAQISARREVENYLDQTIIVSARVNPLSWWRDNMGRFPHVAVLARKWLCVTATSTPSERVFSDCGLGLTAKRSRLNGYILRDQVMIRRNVGCVNITQNDIETFFSRKKKS